MLTFLHTSDFETVLTDFPIFHEIRRTEEFQAEMIFRTTPVHGALHEANYKLKEPQRIAACNSVFGQDTPESAHSVNDSTRSDESAPLFE